MSRQLNYWIACLSLFFIMDTSQASTWVISDDTDIVGEVQYTNAQAGETLSDVGIRFDVGYGEMIDANPQVDAVRPLSTRTQIIIPSQYILPPGPRQGVVINLAEYRLYFYPPGGNVVFTIPVGIGREGWDTPVGITKVISKERDPVWHPSARLINEGAKKGAIIPNEFPGGDGNPLGRYVLRLGWPTYLLHGTNRRNGVGARVSAGCIRILPEDIEQLFELVSIGTSVRVVNESIKLGHNHGKTYFELHPLLNENHQIIASPKLSKFITPKNIGLITNELKSPSGIPRILD